MDSSRNQEQSQTHSQPPGTPSQNQNSAVKQPENFDNAIAFDFGLLDGVGSVVKVSEPSDGEGGEDELQTSQNLREPSQGAGASNNLIDLNLLGDFDPEQMKNFDFNQIANVEFDNTEFEKFMEEQNKELNAASSSQRLKNSQTLKQSSQILQEPQPQTDPPEETHKVSVKGQSDQKMKEDTIADFSLSPDFFGGDQKIQTDLKVEDEVQKSQKSEKSPQKSASKNSGGFNNLELNIDDFMQMLGEAKPEKVGEQKQEEPQPTLIDFGALMGDADMEAGNDAPADVLMERTPALKDESMAGINFEELGLNIGDTMEKAPTDLDIQMVIGDEKKLDQVPDLGISLDQNFAPTLDQVLPLIDEVPEKKKEKLKKESSKGQKVHLNILEFYSLKKIKYSLDFEAPSEGKLKAGHYVYTLVKKEGPDILKAVEALKDDGHKRFYLDLGFHFKKLNIDSIWQLSQVPSHDQDVLTKKKYQRAQAVKLPSESKTYGTITKNFTISKENDQVIISELPPIQHSPTVTNAAPQEINTQRSWSSWWLSPAHQDKFFQNNLGECSSKDEYLISKNLNTLDFLQKDSQYYRRSLPSAIEQDFYSGYSEKKPELYISKFKHVKLKGMKPEEVLLALEPKIKLLVVLSGDTKLVNKRFPLHQDCEGNLESQPGQKLQESGIAQISYKPESLQRTQEEERRLSAYLFTQDGFESSQNWLPQLFGGTRDAVLWSMEYTVPFNTQVVSVGNFVRSEDIETAEGTKTTFLFKSKENCGEDVPLHPHLTGQIIADRVGFVIGHFPYLSSLNFASDNLSEEVGMALFTSLHKLQLFEHNSFYLKQVQECVQNLESMLETCHPSRTEGLSEDNSQHSIKMVFLPNFIKRKSLKQHVNFANCLHLFDEEILLPRNVLEKRTKVYKQFAGSLAFDFFGNMVWEESSRDAWIMQCLRERIGDSNYKKKVGREMYRYRMMRTLEKFCERVENNAERFSLNSSYVPHFSEVEASEDLYLMKCQLVMHILDQILGESHFGNVMKEIFAKAKPTVNTALFKKILKEIGIKFQEIQKNWVDSTSFPKLDLNFDFNKKQNQVQITLEQRSASRDFLLLNQHVQSWKDQLHNLCFDGKVLMEHLRSSAQKDESESFQVETQRDCKRWFSGEVKILIYQTDSADIKIHTQKIKIKHPKTKFQCSIPLVCKVRKAIHKKKEESMFMDDIGDNDVLASIHNQLIGGILNDGKTNQQAAAEQLHHTLNDTNKWQFGMLEYIFDEQQILAMRDLLDIKNFESPILWVRVDPEMEFIRKVKVHQSRENWLFQLLQERDPIAQVEACKELASHNSKDVYEVLKAVAKNEYFFIKVRKHALRALEKIQVAAINKNLSHEKTFLVNFFNQKNFKEKIGFYQSNDFRNVLEYYLNTYLIHSLASSKENRLQLRPDTQEQMKRSRKAVTQALSITGIRISSSKTSKVRESSNFTSLAIDDEDYNFDDPQAHKDPLQLDVRNFSTTTPLISNLFLRLLRENDNSENAFDDCFYISKILSNLGKTDNFEFMPEVSREVLKQFKLDQVGNFSPQFTIIKGAIKGYYNMRRQIYEYRQFKLPFMDPQKHQLDIEKYERLIQEASKNLDKLEVQLQKALKSKHWPLEIRAFIFEKNTKHVFRHSGEPLLNFMSIQRQFLEPLTSQIQFITSLEDDRQTALAFFEILALFVEKNLLLKLNFRQALLDPMAKDLAEMIWNLLTEGISFSDSKLRYWVKRLYNAVFLGGKVPLPLEFEQEQRGIAQPVEVAHELSKDWYQLEAQQQLEADQADGVDQKGFSLDGAGLLDQQPRFDVTPQQTNLGFLGDDLGSNILNMGSQFNAGFDEPGMIDMNMFSGINTGENKKAKKKKTHRDGIGQQDSQEYEQIRYDNWPGEYKVEEVAIEEDVDVVEEIDDFPDYVFPEVWKRKCWDILYILYFDADAGFFVEDISREVMGDELYLEYVDTIKYPINFLNVKKNMIDCKYTQPIEFINDMNLVFANCMQFNKRGSQAYKSAQKCKRQFKDLLRERDVMKHQTLLEQQFNLQF